MSRVDDVVAAILKQTGRIDTWKLQKLVYYCQAWHLVWDDEPLFRDRIEAWANGPVVPALYKEHRGRYQIDTWPRGEMSHLSPSQLESVQIVVDFYASKSGQQLSDVTHHERPWSDARRGLSAGERGNREITKEAMLEYYGGIAAG
jgi:uncharacterized phage-associated protein